MRKGNSPNSRNRQDRGVSVPGAFKLGHLQPVEPILFPKFCNFFTFILGGPILITLERRGAENGKMEFTQPEVDKGISVPGAFKLDHFQPVEQIFFPQIFQLFHFYIGGPILITPERRGLKMGKWNSPNQRQTKGFQCLGHSNWIICIPLSQFWSEYFSDF